MKVIEYNSKIYSLKISIGDYIAIDQLNLVERLSCPSTIDYLTLCSILMNKYDFNEDELCDFMDYITEEYEINEFLKELLLDSGIIENNSEQENNSEESTEKKDQDDVDVTFEEQLDSMLKDCLAYGMSINTFYSMTFKEVKLFIEGIKQRNDVEMRNKSILDYLLANLITTGTGIILGGNGSYPEYEEYYARLFGDEVQEEMVLEGYATDELGNKTPVYKKKYNQETDKARAEMMAIAQQSKLNTMQKELKNN